MNPFTFVFVFVSLYISVKAEWVLLISFIRCFVSIGPKPSDIKYDAFDLLGVNPLLLGLETFLE